MFARLKKLFTKPTPTQQETWPQTLRRLGQELVPLTGEADTLQGELIRCVVNLRSEARRNGWMNFDIQHEEAIETLRRFLPEPEVFNADITGKIHQALDRVLKAGKASADQGEMAYAELDYLAQCVIEWCHQSEELFYKKPGSS